MQDSGTNGNFLAGYDPKTNDWFIGTRRKRIRFLKILSMKKKSPLFFIGILFFIFGFVTWLNSTLVPFLKIACELSNFESYFVTFVFYIAYFVFALPSSGIINRFGYTKSISIGLYVMALGAAFFIPAAYTRYYLFFLVGLFLMGAGLALLQTAANPYAAILGSPETAARRISIMGVCNKFAGVLAPLILGGIILQDTDTIVEKASLLPWNHPLRQDLLDDLAMKCRIPYLLITVCLVVLANFVRFSPLPDIQTGDKKEKGNGHHPLLKKPRFWGGVAALFFYVGAEVISVDSLIGYALDQGISSSTAKVFPALSMVAFIIGYLIGIIGIPRFFSQRSALLFSASASILVAVFSILSPGQASIYVLIGLGLTNAMIWPAVWGLAIRGLGRDTSLGSSLLIMAIVGGALLPLAFGRLVDIFGYRNSYWIMVPCYSIILLYAFFVKSKPAGLPQRSGDA